MQVENPYFPNHEYSFDAFWDRCHLDFGGLSFYYVILWSPHNRSGMDHKCLSARLYSNNAHSWQDKRCLSRKFTFITCLALLHLPQRRVFLSIASAF